MTYWSDFLVKNKRSPVQFIVIITLIIFALLTALVVLNNQSENANNTTNNYNPPPIANQPTLGEQNAKVSIVEFGDYKCPACKAWGEQVYPLLQEEFIDTGKAQFSYINVLFHGEESKLAALAGESIFKQDPASFWTFHKQLFAEQPAENHDALWITNEKILEIAKAYTPNIDLDQLNEDLNNQTTLQEVTIDEELVEKYNVQQTPTIFINGIMVENPFDYHEISSLINKELKDKK
jgi:protein-disulfide isomerase